MKSRYVLTRVFAFIFDFSFVQILIGIFFVPSAQAVAEKFFDYVNNTAPSAVDTNTLQDLTSDLFIASSNDALYIIFAFIIYYVVIANMLGGKTLGCSLFRQKIVKTDNTKLTYSDLTYKMLLTNGGIYYVFLAVIFTVLQSNIQLAAVIFSILALAYSIFLLVNFIMLVSNGVSLVDKITKTRPLLMNNGLKQNI